MSVLAMGGRGANRPNTKSRKGRGGGNSYRREYHQQERGFSVLRWLLGILGVFKLFRLVWGFLRRALIVGLSLLALIGVSLGLMEGYRTISGWQYFALNKVVIQGTERLENQDIMEIGGLSFGHNIFGIDIWDVQSKLSANPWIRWANVRRVMPDTIRITVEERPADYWVKSGEALCYADDNGKVIEEVSADRFATLPLLDLEPECKSCLQELTSFRQALVGNDLFFSSEDVAELRVRGEEGLIVYLDTEKISLNVEMRDWRAGFDKVLQVWNDLRRRGELAVVKSITTRGSKVWVRMAQAPAHDARQVATAARPQPVAAVVRPQPATASMRPQAAATAARPQQAATTPKPTAPVRKER